MPSLLLIIFLTQLTIHIINSIDRTTLSELLWLTYNKFPTPTSAAVRNINAQRRQVMRLRKEMNATSAQDNFSEWAKLRRQHDKADADYEKNASTLKASRSQFDTLATAGRWLSTNGIRFVLQFWFASQPIYWIPRGWMPYYIEWILSFPKAPLGSVSVQSWWIACASVILLVGDAATAVYALGMGLRSWRQEKVKEPMGFKADQTEKEKKEL